MIKTLLAGVPVALLLAATSSQLLAQRPTNPFTTMVTTSWEGVKKTIVASAALVPEEEYGFKPTPQVRSFGQILGHLVNEHYLMCSAVKGEKAPTNTDHEKMVAKAELVKALTESVAYCDAVYSSMTDADAMTPVELFRQEYPTLAVLNLNVTHDSEHYGNLVTYMRLKGHVPPSSSSGR